MRITAASGSPVSNWSEDARLDDSISVLPADDPLLGPPLDVSTADKRILDRIAQFDCSLTLADRPSTFSVSEWTFVLLQLHRHAVKIAQQTVAGGF